MAPTIREKLGELSVSSVEAKENQVGVSLPNGYPELFILILVV